MRWSAGQARRCTFLVSSCLGKGLKVAYIIINGFARTKIHEIGVEDGCTLMSCYRWRKGFGMRMERDG